MISKKSGEEALDPYPSNHNGNIIPVGSYVSMYVSKVLGCSSISSSIKSDMEGRNSRYWRSEYSWDGFSAAFVDLEFPLSVQFIQLEVEVPEEYSRGSFVSSVSIIPREIDWKGDTEIIYETKELDENKRFKIPFFLEDKFGDSLRVQMSGGSYCGVTSVKVTGKTMKKEDLEGLEEYVELLYVPAKSWKDSKKEISELKSIALSSKEKDRCKTLENDLKIALRGKRKQKRTFMKEMKRLENQFLELFEMKISENSEHTHFDFDVVESKYFTRSMKLSGRKKKKHILGKGVEVKKSFESKNKNKVCSVCGESEGEIQHCSKCKIVHYCSRKCQEVDWKYHRIICKAPV